jgi:hypothetical protein
MSVQDQGTIEQLVSFRIPPGGPDPVPLQRVVQAIKDGFDLPVTCQIEVQITKLSSDIQWRLQTFDGRGCAKNVGGDEFYITFHTSRHCIAGNHRPIATAVTTDLDNGQYILQFVSSPMNQSIADLLKKPTFLSVHFQYSCHIGHLSPPIKDSWLNGGCTHTVYLCPLPFESAIELRRMYHPPIQSFQPPHPAHYLDEFDAILAFGDSVMEHLVASRRSNRGSTSAELNSNIWWNQDYKVAMPLSTRTLPVMLEMLKSAIDQFQNDCRGLESRKTALLLGSGMWDILASDCSSLTSNVHGDSATNIDSIDHSLYFQDHIDAMKQYLSSIHAGAFDAIFWLSPASVHIHRVHLFEELYAKNIEHKINRVRYMSSSRTKALYELRGALWDELHFIIVAVETMLPSDRM